MSVPKLSLDQDANRRIVDLNQNVRDEFTTRAAALNDGVTVVYTAEFVVSATNGLTAGFIFRRATEYRAQYAALSTSFTALYSSEYTASPWKTGVDAAIAALDVLTAWIQARAEDTYKATNPAGKYIITIMTTPQKQALANQMLTAIG